MINRYDDKHTKFSQICIRVQNIINVITLDGLSVTLLCQNILLFLYKFKETCQLSYLNNLLKFFFTPENGHILKSHNTKVAVTECCIDSHYRIDSQTHFLFSPKNDCLLKGCSYVFHIHTGSVHACNLAHLKTFVICRGGEGWQSCHLYAHDCGHCCSHVSLCQTWNCPLYCGM